MKQSMIIILSIIGTAFLILILSIPLSWILYFLIHHFMPYDEEKIETVCIYRIPEYDITVSETMIEGFYYHYYQIIDNDNAVSTVSINLDTDIVAEGSDIIEWNKYTAPVDSSVINDFCEHYSMNDVFEPDKYVNYPFYRVSIDTLDKTIYLWDYLRIHPKHYSIINNSHKIIPVSHDNIMLILPEKGGFLLMIPPDRTDMFVIEPNSIQTRTLSPKQLNRRLKILNKTLIHHESFRSS